MTDDPKLADLLQCRNLLALAEYLDSLHDFPDSARGVPILKDIDDGLYFPRIALDRDGRVKTFGPKFPGGWIPCDPQPDTDWLAGTYDRLVLYFHANQPHVETYQRGYLSCGRVIAFRNPQPCPNETF